MKKTLLLISLITCISCSNFEEIDTPNTEQILTRTIQNEDFNVLGMGYDIIGDFLSPLSVKNPVINTKRYYGDYPERVRTGTASHGYDKMYSGFSATDYLQNITEKTSINQNSNLLFFTNSISRNTYLSTKYSYSDKYSFASLDIIRNLKYIRINDTIDRLSQYLSEEFKEDLKRLSPDEIVKRYGTHVLIDFNIGGRYKLMYKTAIIKTIDFYSKKEIVESGFNLTLKKIGLGINMEHSTQIDENLAKENHCKELYVLFFGGNGTNIIYDLENNMPSSVDIRTWENSLTLSNANLTYINWSETYPLDCFISDTEKKEEIRQAIERYINNNQLEVMELIPLYQLYQKNGNNSFYTSDYSEALLYTYNWGYNLEKIQGYVYKQQKEGTLPLYQLYQQSGNNAYYTTDYNQVLIHCNKWGYKLEKIQGYLLKNQLPGTLPLYELFQQDGNNSFYTSDYNEALLYVSNWGYKIEGILGYLYPNN